MKAFRLVDETHDPIKEGELLTRTSDHSHQKLADGMYFALSREAALSFATKPHGHRYTHLLYCDLDDIEMDDLWDEIVDPNRIARFKSQDESPRQARARYGKENNKKGFIWQARGVESWTELCLLSEHVCKVVRIVESEQLATDKVSA